MQGRGDPEGFEIGRLAAADPVGVLDELGDDQRRGEESERGPVVDSVEQLEPRDDERCEAERDHGGVRGRRAHAACIGQTGLST